MPILSVAGGRSWSQRFFVWFLYTTLGVFGASMAVPFLMTLTSSTANDFDYDRFSIFPHSLWSKEDRFVKGIVYFINRYPNWFTVLQNQFDRAPGNWTSWRAIGLDKTGIHRLAEHYTDVSDAEWERWIRQAADYAEFAADYPIEDTLATFSNEQAAEFLAFQYERSWEARNPEIAAQAGERERREAALALISETWAVPVANFFALNFDREIRAPMGQQSWLPPRTPKQSDFDRFRRALLHGYATPGVLQSWRQFLRERGYSGADAAKLAPLPDDAAEEDRALWTEFSRTTAPASPVIPFPMQPVWLNYLASDEAKNLLGLPKERIFDIALFNERVGTSYSSPADTPFPLPEQGFDALRPAWERFIETRYPLRLTSVTPTANLRERYEAFLRTYPSLANLNDLLGTAYTGFHEVPLPTDLPRDDAMAELWMNFVKSLPAGDRRITSSESAYQHFLLKKYSSVDAVNAAYGWSLERIEEARPPFDKAYAVTYARHANAVAWAPLLSNYGTITQFLIHQGNAIPVTLWLVVLTIFMTLTVNPMAAYALSRFNLSGKDKIILFCLATSAFPAMVSAIPGYLLMRDIGLLNTFYALVLPGAANGMAIFILKGFFDSLPQELFEAATIDGAREWQIFGLITLPMVKPIMAINALNAFIAAYSGWEWALIIAQDQRMWTLSVWLYQASHWWAHTPWITTAGFVIASIPTLIVFLFCQKIILRGIVVPSMK